MSRWTAAAMALVILAAAAPYVARVRHPRQKPFAAYLLFVTVFAVSAVVLFLIIGGLVSSLGLTDILGQWGMAVLLVLLGVLPAIAFATVQVRKPPIHRGPPD